MENFIFCAVNKTNWNVTFVCKCYFVEALFKELWIKSTSVSNNKETDVNHNKGNNDVYNINNVNDQLIMNKHVSRKPFNHAIDYIFCHGLAHPNFLNFTNTLPSTSGTWSSMFVNYFEDVSELLATISFVRELNIEMNLDAERALLSQFFAITNPNYSRYLVNQHFLLKVLCI